MFVNTDFKTYHPNVWQRIRMLFSPSIVGVDCCNGATVTVVGKHIDGKLYVVDVKTVNPNKRGQRDDSCALR